MNINSKGESIISIPLNDVEQVSISLILRYEVGVENVVGLLEN